MLKLIVLFCLALTAYGSLLESILGGLNPQPTITEDVYKSAEWCTSELTKTYNHIGEHHITNIHDYTKQIVQGVIYRFIIDYVVIEPNNNLSVSLIY